MNRVERIVSHLRAPIAAIGGTTPATASNSASTSSPPFSSLGPLPLPVAATSPHTSTPRLASQSSAAVLQSLPSWIVLRRLEPSDYDKGFPAILSQLTTVGAVSRELFLQRFASMFGTGVSCGAHARSAGTDAATVTGNAAGAAGSDEEEAERKQHHGLTEFFSSSASSSSPSSSSSSAFSIPSSTSTNVFVFEDTNKGVVIGAGTLLVENKFIHACGRVGHVEDIVVDKAYRGYKLGAILISFLNALAREAGCYKVILDCDEHNVAFYEKLGYKRKAVHMALYNDKN